jgi:hypothetical protein
MKKKLYEIDGKELTLKEICEIYEINKTTLTSRMFKYKISPKEAILNYTSKRKRIIQNDRFGHLVATGKTIKGVNGNAIYEVKCDCGNVIQVLGICLKKKNKVSCNIRGCNFSKKISHGNASRLSRTKVYRAWSGIKDRCLNKNNPSYMYYGGIGITIAEEFKKDFLTFYEEIGDPPSDNHSVDRINVNKGYEKGNIRWATKKEQALNRRKVNELTLEIQKLRKLLHENKYDEKP